MNLPTDWAIKTRVILPDLCVAFAGSATKAVEGMSEVRGQGLSRIEDAVNLLTKHHRDSRDSAQEYDVEYLVASHSRAWEIKHGRAVEKSESGFGYVGSDVAMRRIQSRIERCADERAVCGELRSILYDRDLRSVGGFAIATAFRGDRFQYIDDFFHNAEMNVISAGPQGWYSATSVAGGEYTEEIVVDNDHSFVGIYFLVGKCGIGFPQRAGEMRAYHTPKGIQMTAREFEQWCESQFGCKVVALNARIYENGPEANISISFRASN